jgi:hypothetical protein
MLPRVIQRTLSAFRGADLLVLALLALSLALNVYFIRSHSAEILTKGATGLVGIPVGSKVPPLVAKALDGQPREIRFDETSHPTVLYIFSPSCGWCKRNSANIKLIASQRSASFRFLGFALSGTDVEVSDYLARYPLGFDVLLSPSSKTREAFHFGVTPDTWAIDRNGGVLKHWQGAFSRTDTKDVETFFGVSLPGLLPENTASLFFGLERGPPLQDAWRVDRLSQLKGT